MLIIYDLIEVNMGVLIYIKFCINLVRLWPHLICYGISRKKGLIRKDIAKWMKEYEVKGNSVYGLLYFLAFFPEFRSVYYYRLGILSLPLNWICGKCESLFITTQDIGGGLFIQHGFATIISAGKMGENCWVNQQVTIGYSNKTDCPIIGNEVKIHAGAKIIGRVTIGDYAVIGANATVVKNVPAHAVVVGNPARIIRINGQKVDLPLG